VRASISSSSSDEASFEYDRRGDDPFLLLNNSAGFE
jgi:hypothetical protein